MIKGDIGRPGFGIGAVGDGWNRCEVTSVRWGERQDVQRWRVRGRQGRIGRPSGEACRARAEGVCMYMGQGSGDG